MRTAAGFTLTLAAVMVFTAAILTGHGLAGDLSLAAIVCGLLLMRDAL